MIPSLFVVACQTSAPEPPADGTPPDTGQEPTSPSDTATPTTAGDLDEDGFMAPEDCDDTDPSVHPGARDVCDDGVDQNCDGLLDCGLYGQLDAAAVATSTLTSTFGTAVDVRLAPDVTSDGVPDLWISHDDFQTRRTWLLSGVAPGDVDIDAAAILTLTESGAPQTGWGDLDGDGSADLLLAFDDSGGHQVLAIPSSARGDHVAADAALISVAGALYATSGDFDGDGADDLVTGAWVADQVWMFPGPVTPGPLDVTVAGSAITVDPGAGVEVNNIGDPDGDGIDNLVVLSVYDAGSNGVARIYDDLPADWTSDAITTITGKNVGYLQTAEGGRDLDGDGLEDLVVGQNGRYHRTGAYVFLGLPAGDATVDDADAKVEGCRGFATGLDVALGDVSGDGNAELLLSDTSYYADGVETESLVRILYGPFAGSWESCKLETGILTHPEADTSTQHVEAGDLDGDGIDDIVVTYDDSGYPNGLHTWVIPGGPTL